MELVTPRDYVLGDVSLIPHTLASGSTWLGIAEGNKRMRAGMRVRRRTDGKPIEVMDVCFCTEWVGELPTQDQN